MQSSSNDNEVTYALSEVTNSKNLTNSLNETTSTTAPIKRKSAYDLLGIHHKFLKLEPAC